MFEPLITKLVGNLGEKRAYRTMMKRLRPLPKEYRFAFREMQHYLYTVGYPADYLTIFSDLLDLLEQSAGADRPIAEVLGKDVSTFCDDIVHASSANTETPQEKLNREIWEHFNKEVHR